MAIIFPEGTQNYPCKIIQCVSQQNATSVSTTSTSYQDISDLTKTLTLQSSSHKVLVALVLQIETYGDEDRRCEAAIFHTDMTNRYSQATTGEYKTGDSGSYSYGSQTHYALVSPGTTSMTFKAGFRSVDGSTVGVKGHAGYWRSYFVLQEVEA